MADLFLVDDRIYQSEHAGDFRATSTYEPFNVESFERQAALVSLLRRLDAVEYDSTEQIDDQIEQYKEWESLFDELMAVLEKHGKHDAFGDGDYYLISDYYSSAQHKVECTSPLVFTPSLLVDVQGILKRYSRRWEVIFALPAIEGKDHAYSVYVDECIEHAG
ncbi:MAG: hypothetical protein JNN20_07025 [Betaproteobacteria bacterium]|nr:hypothetical protein [Betaproteobacteria bacterium]